MTAAAVLRFWTVWSALAASIVSGVVQWAMFSGYDGGTSSLIIALPALGFSAVWVGLTVMAVKRHRHLGLLALLGAPFALATPIVMGLAVLACISGECV